VSVGERGRAVAIGGGTGLPQVLRCLVEIGFETSAVVTMADDGGSSGVLRRHLGILPRGRAQLPCRACGRGTWHAGARVPVPVRVARTSRAMPWVI
jgi:2-phospho-L-lactate transferase/gluconeogenesis factor (CofD/UPF0052 family)